MTAINCPHCLEELSNSLMITALTASASTGSSPDTLVWTSPAALSVFIALSLSILFATRLNEEKKVAQQSRQQAVQSAQQSRLAQAVAESSQQRASELVTKLQQEKVA